MREVRAFHAKFGQPAPAFPPAPPDPDLVRFRMRLMKEEFEEVREQMALLARAESVEGSLMILQDLLKELCDLQYNLQGTALALGLPFEAAYAEVHRSNMTKDANPEGGKALKGEAYSPADMERLVPLPIDGTAEAVGAVEPPRPSFKRA